jgi:hypothetical protein
MRDEDTQALEKSARLMSWGNPHTEQVLCGLLLDVASHTDRSGVNSHIRWCASMTAFGKTLLALAEREKLVHKE